MRASRPGLCAAARFWSAKARWVALAVTLSGLSAWGGGAISPDLSVGFDAGISTGGSDAGDAPAAPSIIALPTTSGPSPLTVHFSCDGGGASPRGYIWDFGEEDAGLYSGPTATVTYPAGRYHVSLTVIEADGGVESAHKATITVTDSSASNTVEPPDCRAAVSPVPGSVGQPMFWFDDGGAISVDSNPPTKSWVLTWSDPPGGKFVDGGTAEHTFGSPTWVSGRLTVVADDGLSCTDTVTTYVEDETGAPPAPLIIGAANPDATCGEPYSYSPSGAAIAVGEGPFLWAADGPPGFSIDRRTGRISWTPRPDQAGKQTITLSVTGTGGTSRQRNLEVEVSCPDVKLETPFGCGSAGAFGLLPALLGLAGWLWLSKRRPSEAGQRSKGST